MFRCELIALEYPEPDSFNVSDDEDFSRLILWLEDQKIRCYTIDDRKNLREFEDRVAWNKAYDAYKENLGCPIFESKPEELAWILSHAVRLEYLDQAHILKDSNSMKPIENEFKSIDLNSDEFEQNIRKLGKLLGITEHPDHMKILEASAKVIERSGQATANPTKEKLAYSLKDDSLKLFEDNDMNEAAKILRLLQIHSVRDLQTKINETIVNVQALTANPKTDTKLGKVGK